MYQKKKTMQALLKPAINKNGKLPHFCPFKGILKWLIYRRNISKKKTKCVLCYNKSTTKRRRFFMIQKNNFLNTNIKISLSRTLLSGILDTCCYQIGKNLLNKRQLRGRSPSASRTRILGDDDLFIY